MATRAMARGLSASVAMNRITPAPTSTDHSQVMLNENTCAAMVEPTSAPSITASAIGSAISPRAANEASSSAVAVELCSRPVRPTPATNALPRPVTRVAMMRRSAAPNARVMPVRTMRTPHSSSATPPTKAKSSSVPGIPRRSSLRHAGRDSAQCNPKAMR